LISFTVDTAAAGTAVRDVMRRRLKLSRSLYRRLWAQGGVSVDGLPAEPFAPLREGQILDLDLAPLPPRVQPEPMDLAIAYEDADVVVVDKPAGLVVHPTRGFSRGTLAAGLVHRYGAFHLIGRLDMETSGLLLVARHPLAAARLTGGLRGVRRTYRALVHGEPDPFEGRIEAPIGPVPGAARRAVDPSGKPAVTSYRVFSAGAGRALCDLVLETGRTHQIRVHMAHLGNPVVGDDRYGPQPRAWPRLCLHATLLEFPHPLRSERICLESAWPADLP
jgi:23S rRNA pseudouridine1911/1915/1917 synthase